MDSKHIPTDRHKCSLPPPPPDFSGAAPEPPRLAPSQTLALAGAALGLLFSTVQAQESQTLLSNTGQSFNTWKCGNCRRLQTGSRVHHPAQTLPDTAWTASSCT